MTLYTMVPTVTLFPDTPPRLAAAVRAVLADAAEWLRGVGPAESRALAEAQGRHERTRGDKR